MTSHSWSPIRNIWPSVAAQSCQAMDGSFYRSHRTGCGTHPPRCRSIRPSDRSERHRLRFPPRIGKHHPTAQILVSCHPKRAFEATCQPSRHAHMIRVHVRRYHTGDGSAGWRPLRSEQGEPRVPDVHAANARVHDRPARTVAQCPEVDVIRENGSGMRSHSTPGLISVAWPGVGDPRTDTRVPGLRRS